MSHSFESTSECALRIWTSSRIDRDELKLDRAGFSKINKKLSILIVAVCLALLAGMFYAPVRTWISSVEHWTADWRTSLLSDLVEGTHSGIAVVVITNQTLAAYPYQSPTPRDLIAKLVSAADDAGGRVIGLDFYFARPTEAERDQALITAVNGARSPVVLGAIDKRHKQFNDREFKFQDAFLAKMNADVGYIDLQHENDDVVRYTSLSVDSKYQDSFAALLAAKSGSQKHHSRERIAWLRGSGRGGDAFTTIPAEDLLEFGKSQEQAKQISERISGRTVLISGEYPYLDRHRIPLSIWSGEKLSGVKIHAHIVAQQLDDRHYSELTPKKANFLIAGVALVGGLLGWLFARRKMDFLGLTAATIGLVILDALIYSQLRVILPFTLALWAWVLGVTAGHHLRNVVARS